MTACVRRTRTVRSLLGNAALVGMAAAAWSGGTLMARPAAGQQPPAPQATRDPGAPAGDVIKAEFDQSKIYPGTWREYWVYVPKQLDRAKPAPVMVFQDGLQYNAPVVFDNLIHDKAMPPIVGVFVMHGRVKAPSADALDRMNRSFEYDAVSGDYARFLLDELLPHVAQDARAERCRPIRTTAPSRATAAAPSPRSPPPGSGPTRSAASSAPSAPTSACAAATSFPTLIRKTEPKPIRIFLQDGRNDLNNYAGGWWIANQDMQSALEFAGYEVRHEWGDGEHNSTARDRALSRRAALAVARLARADQGQPGRQVDARTSSRAGPRRRLAARQRGPRPPTARRSTTRASCSSPTGRTTASTRSGSTGRSASSPRTPTAPTA